MRKSNISEIYDSKVTDRNSGNVCIEADRALEAESGYQININTGICYNFK